MKNRGLIALLIAGFLSCSTISNMTQQKHYILEKIVLDLSGKGVSILEDTDGDGIFDTSLNYKVSAEKKPNYLLGNSRDFYFLEFESAGVIAPVFPSDENEIPFPILPEEKTKYFNEDLKRDVRWSY